MFKKGKASCFCALLFVVLMLFGMQVMAQEDPTLRILKKGVFAEGIDLSGMTTEQAQEAIENFIAELGKAEITLLAEENQKVVVTANDMGLAWTNTEILDEALGLCTEGNVIARYKAIKDLERGHKVYPIEFAFSAEAIEKILLEKCTVFDRAMKEFKLKKVGETFRITEGYDGYALNVAESLQAITAVMNENWNREGVQIALVTDVTKTKGSTESLSQVKDILGTNTSSYVTSADGRSANVERGAYLMNGVLLYPGEEFSALKLATPFSIANGYHLAGSYLNGKVVDSLGGGICQVTTCLYNAVLQAELEVVERYNHSMTVPYAEPAADAAITQSGGKDFRFVNNKDYPIYVEAVWKDKVLTFNIYGKETRDAKRTISYVSEVLEVINPVIDQITPDPTQPIGYISVQGAHIGYSARLWKVEAVNGKVVKTSIVNNSKYRMSPRSAVVGVATNDPAQHNEIMAAIGTANIDHVKNVIALLMQSATSDDVEDDN